MANKFYAVKKGRTPGIYFDWESCKKQVDGFPGAIYKSFKTIEEAYSFVDKDIDNANKLHKYLVNDDITAYMVQNDNEKPDTDLMTVSLDDDSAIAYVDGSYNDLTKEYAYGVVFFTKDGMSEFSKAFSDPEMAEMRNVSGEITGAMLAMELAKNSDLKKLTIYHDYEGIAKWCTGEWKTNKEGTKRYKAFFDEISPSLCIEFIKVKAHSNDKYNDMADRLAKSALGI